MKAWCHQLFPEYNILSGYASYPTYPNRCYHGWNVHWCEHGDEKNPHWCYPSQSAKWKDCQICVDGCIVPGMKSVTCNFPKT